MTRTAQPLSTEFVLLGILMDHPLHGYEVFKTIQTTPEINQIINIKLSLVYAMLDKLEQLGLVKNSVVDDGSLPVRRVYEVLAEGRAAFEEWRGSPVDHPREIRQEFLARLYFSLQAGKAATKELLQRQLTICDQWQQFHQMHISETEGDTFSRILLDFKQSQIDSITSWVKFTLESLE